MNSLITAISILVALLHIGFMVLEMFLWTKPIGLKIFGQSLAAAQGSATLAANQGLYNGFLAAGLIWGLLTTDVEQSRQIQIFFLSCVAVAGLYGGWSVSSKIIFVQAVPAIAGLAVIMFASNH